MKSYLLIVLLCLGCLSPALSQELLIEGGKSVTSFSFKDVLANDLDNLRSTNNTYLDMGYRAPLFGEQVQFLLGVGVHTYGSVGSAESSNSYFQYETTFGNIQAGLDIQLIKAGRFTTHAKALVSPEFMLQGTQTLDNQVIDIRGADDFDSPVIFLRAALSFEYKVTQTIATFFQFRYGQGKQLKSSESGGELTYFAQDFGLGLLFDLSIGKDKVASEEK